MGSPNHNLAPALVSIKTPFLNAQAPVPSRPTEILESTPDELPTVLEPPTISTFGLDAEFAGIRMPDFEVPQVAPFRISVVPLA